MASLFLCYAHLTRQPISHLTLSTAELDLSVFSALLHPWLGLFPAQKKGRIIPAINADCMKSGGRWKFAAQERRLKYSGSRLTAGSLLPAYAGAIETPSQTENNDRMVNPEQDTITTNVSDGRSSVSQEAEVIQFFSFLALIEAF